MRVMTRAVLDPRSCPASTPGRSGHDRPADASGSTTRRGATHSSRPPCHGFRCARSTTTAASPTSASLRRPPRLSPGRPGDLEATHVSRETTPSVGEPDSRLPQPSAPGADPVTLPSATDGGPGSVGANDSASADEVLGLLHVGDHSLPHAVPTPVGRAGQDEGLHEIGEHRVPPAEGARTRPTVRGTASVMAPSQRAARDPGRPCSPSRRCSRLDLTAGAGAGSPAPAPRVLRGACRRDPTAPIE